MHQRDATFTKQTDPPPKETHAGSLKATRGTLNLEGPAEAERRGAWLRGSSGAFEPLEVTIRYHKFSVNIKRN